MEENSGLLVLLEELQRKANFKPGDLFVCGCSTSEIIGQAIGSQSSIKVAKSILSDLLPWASKYNLQLAIQGCEHINRALVVEREGAIANQLTIVNVIPYREAGGALSEEAMKAMKDPVVVEDLRGLGAGGMDIGDTFIGMHMRPVGVPLRLSSDTLGEAHITFIRSREKLIGGDRAKHF